MTRVTLALLALAGVALWSGPARSADGLELRPATGAAPARLDRTTIGYQAEILVRNGTRQPITVERLGMLEGSERAPRLPLGVKATFADGRPVAKLAPGEAKKAIVRWTPSSSAPLREVYGHVYAKTSDGATTRLGVHAERPTATPWLFNHAISWLLLLPLLGVLSMAGAHFSRFGKSRSLRRLAIGVTGAQLALAAWIVARFDTTVSRLDGNDGFQMIERGILARPLGVEYSVGVDGLSVGLVVTTTLVAFAAALFTRGADKRFWMLLLICDGACVGTFVALDGSLLCAFLAASVVGFTMLMATGDRGARAAAAKFGVHGVIGVGLTVWLFTYLSRHAPNAFLSDGSVAGRSLSIPELMRVEWLALGLEIGGSNATAVLFIALLVASLCLTAAFPLHTWLADGLEAMPTGGGMLLLGAGTPVGVYVLIRVGYGILPAGFEWASATVALLGAAGAVYASIGALGQTDLRRLVASVAVAHAGLAVVAAASLVAVGVGASILILVGNGVAAAASLAQIGHLTERSGTSNVERLGGLIGEMPRQGAILGVALLAMIGAPGTILFAPQVLGIASAAPLHPAVTLLAGASLVVAATAVARGYGRAYFGEVPNDWRQSPLLEPHGGRFPDLREGELMPAIPLVAAIAITGLFPRTLGRFVDSAALDYGELANPPGPLQIVRATPPRKSPVI